MSAVSIFAMLAPCSEVTTQSLFVLVSSRNDATAGTKLLEMLNLISQHISYRAISTQEFVNSLGEGLFLQNIHDKV